MGVPEFYERMTEGAQKVMMYAQQEAQRVHHDRVGTEHILLGIIREGTGFAAQVLRNLGVEPRKVRQEIEKMIQPGPGTQPSPRKLEFNPHANSSITHSYEEA